MTIIGLTGVIEGIRKRFWMENGVIGACCRLGVVIVECNESSTINRAFDAPGVLVVVGGETTGLDGPRLPSSPRPVSIVGIAVGGDDAVDIAAGIAVSDCRCSCCWGGGDGGFAAKRTGDLEFVNPVFND